MYFPEHKLAIEVDIKGHKDRGKKKDRKRGNDLKERCEIIRISPDREDFDMYVEICKIDIDIIESIKKSLVVKISGQIMQ